MPWRTVIDNVRFGLELQRWSGEDLTVRARRYVELVGLKGFEHYHPHQLSCGMRQRVGIARALAVDPIPRADTVIERRLCGARVLIYDSAYDT